MEVAENLVSAAVDHVKVSNGDGLRLFRFVRNRENFDFSNKLYCFRDFHDCSVQNRCQHCSPPLVEQALLLYALETARRNTRAIRFKTEQMIFPPHDYTAIWYNTISSLKNVFS